MIIRILALSLALLIGAALGQALTAQAGAPPGVMPVQFCDGTHCASMTDAGALLVTP
jgi:hypothetical protein